jgi:CubicO group peptidase (beta-lactamase class C family)
VSTEEDFLATVARFERAVDERGRPLGMKSFFMSKSGERFGHEFAGGGPEDLRSLCKTVVALTVGVAIDRGWRLGPEPLSLGTDVGALLQRAPALRELDPAGAWSGVELGHLLSHTTGHDQGFFFRADLGGIDPADYLAYIFGRPLEHRPGTHFAYSNVGFYLVAVLFQEFLGRSFGEVADELLLEPIGIAGAEWKRRGAYTAGCTGLLLHPPQLHTLAELVAADGVHEGRRIVPEAWCRTMRTTVVATPELDDPADVLPLAGYGYGLWTTHGETCFGWGTDGQYLIVDPVRDLVITTLADQPDMRPIAECLAPLLGPAGS